MLPRSRTLPARIQNGEVEPRQDVRHYLQVETQPKAQNRENEAMNIEASYSKCFNDDGRLKRTGTVWTATSHIITAVIGSGVLSLAWAVGQLGWVVGPLVLTLFAFVNLYTSNLLSKCYRSGDPVTGQRNYTYMDAVKANLGGRKVKICGLIQYINLFGVAIGYTIAAHYLFRAIKRSNCFHKSHKQSECHMSSNEYMITFGIIEILFSQIPDFDQVWWLSIVAAVMSFTYSTVGLLLGVAQVTENKSIKGSLTGISIGTMTEAGVVTAHQKMWRSLQALGAIAFAYSFSIILIEIQDTVKSPPAEHKTMKKATTISIAVTTTFYLLCGCMGYAAFGDEAPGNLLTGFGFYDPYWLLDIANLAIVIHLVGAYQVTILSNNQMTSCNLADRKNMNLQQVYCQPLFAFVEKSDFVTAEYDIPVPFYGVYQLNFFRLVWRTCFVIFTTLIAMLLPFFNDVVGLLGALGFWPLTVYFPVQMYIAKNKIGRWISHWIGLQMLSMACLFVSIAAAVGSVAGVVLDLRTYKPFKTRY
ncbi:hypothetical protein ACS0TY_003988 [Phlomoides rotata]